MLADKRKLYILLGLIVVVAIVVVIIIFGKSAKTQQPTGEINTPGKETVGATSVPKEAALSQDEAVTTTSITKAAEIIASSVSVVNGTNLITKDNKVITPDGAPVRLDVAPSSAEAPKESAPISLSQVPDGANTVKIAISKAGFVPSTFTVKEGQLVNFVLTSTDAYTHVFLLDDAALSGITLGVFGGETRMKSWNAPQKGTYTFRCNVIGHAERGEVGTMIVQ